SDGLLWTTTVGQITVIDTPSYLSLAWSGTDLLLVGRGFYAHTDGSLTLWTKSTTMLPAGGGGPYSVANSWFADAMWDGSQFLVSDVFDIYLSSDLVTWSISNSNITFTYDMVKANATYVAAASDGIYSSSNGSDWTLRQAIPVGAGTYFYFKGAVWDAANSQFVVMGVDVSLLDSGRIFTSADGISWTERATGLSKTLNGLFNDGNQSIVYGDLGAFKVSTDVINWNSPEGHGGYGVRSAASDGGSGWVVVARTGIVGRSTDGVNWNWLSRPCSTWTTGENWMDLAYGNGKYVAVGQEGCIMNSVDDGATWSEITPPVSDQLNDVIWDGAQFVAVGVAGTILTSPDGTGWTQRTSPSSETLITAVYDGNGLYVAVGNNGTVLNSANGIDWTQPPAPTGNHIRALTFGNGKFVAGAAVGVLLTSSDGVNWDTPYLYSITNALTATCYDGTTYAAFSDIGDYFTSTDAVNWSKQPNLPISLTLDCVTNSLGDTIAVGSGGMLLMR
ncbi:MAG: hypothetical protein OEZ16_07360, partial [Chromatiales bacterium]|nr:hypothetical protein [Chromatiales bacterium]